MSAALIQMLARIGASPDWSEETDLTSNVLAHPTTAIRAVDDDMTLTVTTVKGERVITLTAGVLEPVEILSIVSKDSGAGTILRCYYAGNP